MAAPGPDIPACILVTEGILEPEVEDCRHPSEGE
jgi:hypothetical protein